MTLLEKLKYALSVLESIPQEYREYMEDHVLDEEIDYDGIIETIKQAETKIPRVCTSCGHVMAFPDVHACPYCGKHLEEV